MANAVVSQVQLPDGTVLVELRGELDLAVDAALRSLMEDIVATIRPPRLVVDMQRVTFVDSTGVGALIAGRTAAKEHGIDFVVRRVAPFIEERLRLIGAYDWLVGE